MGGRALAFLAALAISSAAAAETRSDEAFARAHRATVTMEPSRCAGVLVEDGRHVLTAAHCVREGERRLSFETFQGRRVQGEVEALDRARDMALVHLDEEVEAVALRLSHAPPEPGDALFFGGRNDRPGAEQRLHLERRGRCPSLPGVPDALFTTMRGEKGDSGAPLLDADGEVVGLVHGGAACHIAAPTAVFAQRVQSTVGAERQCRPEDAAAFDVR